MITLKDFQKNVVDKLRSFTAPEYGVNELIIKAPTGSGKTICLLSWIDDYISTTHDNVAFVWFTPGAGELEEQGRFDTLAHPDRLQERERYAEVDYRGNRLDLLHAFHELDRVIHLPVSKVEAILKRFFLQDGRPKKETLLQLDAQEWTAFILNNWRVLREEFRTIDVKKAVVLDLENIQQNDFTPPLEERYTYNPKVAAEPVRTSAYEGYTTASIAVRPSLVERLFERYLETRDDVDFVYKNGDKGTRYFSLAFGTNGGRSHFYPDYIVQMKNGDVYIIETKGGKTHAGQDKNIDPYAPAKYEALKDYAKRHNIKWAFVRDFDEKLWYLNSGEWTDEMRENWLPIDNLWALK